MASVEILYFLWVADGINTLNTQSLSVESVPGTLGGGNPVRATESLAELNRRAAIYSYHRLSRIIPQQIEDEWVFTGASEVDKFYFGG